VSVRQEWASVLGLPYVAHEKRCQLSSSNDKLKVFGTDGILLNMDRTHSKRTPNRTLRELAMRRRGQQPKTYRDRDAAAGSETGRCDGMESTGAIVSDVISIARATLMKNAKEKRPLFTLFERVWAVSAGAPGCEFKTRARDAKLYPRRSIADRRIRFASSANSSSSFPVGPI
jgi:hypothetical protein